MTIVNFYRQPSHDTALNVLLGWSSPERCVVAGDFNAKHYSWQTGRLEDRGKDIAVWAAQNSLRLLNTADVPTNPHGNTIDLAFSNIALAAAVVEDHLATSSDHFTLCLTLPDITLTLPQVPGKVRVTTEDELRRFRELALTGTWRIPQGNATALELDNLAAALVDLLQSAATQDGHYAGGARALPLYPSFHGFDVQYKQTYRLRGFAFSLVKNLSISTKSGAEDGVLGRDDASDAIATIYGVGHGSC